MEKKKYNYIHLGMSFGFMFGGGIGVLLFVFTNNPLSFTVIMIGLVIGLILGAYYENNTETRELQKARDKNGQEKV